MNSLNSDIIILISYNLNFDNILNFSIINKYTYFIFDDKYYETLSKIYYGDNFWLIANNRPIKLSNPLNNYKKEIIRIKNFQKTLDRLNYNRWTTKVFYNYWNKQQLYFGLD